jgi:hypothetical protein
MLDERLKVNCDKKSAFYRVGFRTHPVSEVKNSQLAECSIAIKVRLFTGWDFGHLRVPESKTVGQL